MVNTPDLVPRTPKMKEKEKEEKEEKEKQVRRKRMGKEEKKIIPRTS